jgi:hypothetical protein
VKRVVALDACFVLAASVALAEPHHAKHASCKPSKAERAAAGAFVGRVKQGIARYRDVTQAIADGYATDGKPTNAVMHYDSEQARKDGAVLDPARPESLVYRNTYQGPELLGALFSMGGSGIPGPRFGGCLTVWHSHTVCSPPAGPARPATEGTCPPGMTPRKTGDMIHTWIVPMKGGPYAHRVDDTYRCWLKSLDCETPSS